MAWVACGGCEFGMWWEVTEGVMHVYVCTCVVQN